VQETVETVSGHLPLVNPTLLKQGVNENSYLQLPAWRWVARPGLAEAVALGRAPSRAKKPVF
jgi:hypothetical protein